MPTNISHKPNLLVPGGLAYRAEPSDEEELPDLLDLFDSDDEEHGNLTQHGESSLICRGLQVRVAECVSRREEHRYRDLC